MRDYEHLIGLALTVGAWVALIVLATIIGGCVAAQPRPSPVPVQPPTQIIWNTIQSTDWLMSLLLIGCVLGLFAGLNGLKAGWLGVISCIGGLALKAALTNTYVYWLCGFLFVGSVLVALASILYKNTALREIIKGVQNAKTMLDNVNPMSGNNFGGKLHNAVNDNLGSVQSKPTQKLVQYVKADLKIKGEI